MTPAPVLIAGFSGRALAQSARRAGFQPLVVDGYGDLDMSEVASACEVLPDVTQVGFRASTLRPALTRLAQGACAPPIGLVLGAGFEATPRLLETLSRDFALLGCGSDCVANAKDPAKFFPLLRELGIAHPETRIAPVGAGPADHNMWLSKRKGGMGGLHIRPLGTRASLPDHRYAQQRISGDAISATVLVTAQGPAFAFARTWCAPTPSKPYRFGGIVGNVTLDAELETRLIDLMLTLLPHLQLKGLVSFDFIISDGETFLLEVNPRPGAALDVLDDENGTLFHAHVLSTQSHDSHAAGQEPLSLLSRQWRPTTRASAYLYADRNPLTVPSIDWPAWVHDRPREGTHVQQHAPVATVHASASTPDLATKLCRERLGELAGMLYE